MAEKVMLSLPRVSRQHWVDQDGSRSGPLKVKVTDVFVMTWSVV